MPPKWSTDYYYAIDRDLLYSDWPKKRKTEEEAIIRAYTTLSDLELQTYYDAAKSAYLLPKETEPMSTCKIVNKNTFIMETEITSMMCKLVDGQFGLPAIEFLLNDAILFGEIELDHIITKIKDFRSSKGYLSGKLAAQGHSHDREFNSTIKLSSFSEAHLEIWVENKTGGTVFVSLCFKNALSPFLNWVESFESKPIAPHLAANFGRMDVGQMMLYNLGGAMELVGQAAAINYTSTDQRFQLLEID